MSRSWSSLKNAHTKGQILDLHLFSFTLLLDIYYWRPLWIGLYLCLHQCCVASNLSPGHVKAMLKNKLVNHETACCCNHLNNTPEIWALRSRYPSSVPLCITVLVQPSWTLNEIGISTGLPLIHTLSAHSSAIWFAPALFPLLTVITALLDMVHKNSYD